MCELSSHELACSHRWRKKLLAQTKAQCLNNAESKFWGFQVLGFSSFVQVKEVICKTFNLEAKT